LTACATLLVNRPAEVLTGGNFGDAAGEKKGWKTNMVPSDPLAACSPAGMHGQNVAASNDVT
jgi:hypothetical protein